MDSIKSRVGLAVIGAAIGIIAPLIAYYEGFMPKTYVDPVGIPTVCYGQTGAAAKPGAVYTQEEGETMMAGEIVAPLARLDQCLQSPLAPHEWAALTSLAYNVGTGAICSSTIARMIRAGAPGSEWCEQFPRWVYAGGKVLPGLVKRRAAERKICIGEAA